LWERVLFADSCGVIWLCGGKKLIVDAKGKELEELDVIGAAAEGN